MSVDTSKREYWEQHYRKEHTRDPKAHSQEWYASYEHVKELVQLYLGADTKGDRILVLGCGTSMVSEKLWVDGWSNIASIVFPRNHCA